MANFLDIIAGEGPAVTFIRGLVNTTMSASGILSELSNAGLGIRRQTGLQVINYLRQTVAPSRSYISNLTLNALPTISRLPLNPIRQLRNFNYQMVVRGFSNLTGELLTNNIQVNSDKLLTKQQAMDLGEAIAESESPSGNMNGASAQVTDIFQKNDGLVLPTNQPS